ncbi:MAG: cytochrome c oxidase subunit II [SAR116 cluster bacterium]|nr:cytochrome c oxidase subunit II [SAR116 cluster bacterium]RPH09585.1 MAG: cytochrome c oxidase subunit II [Alphaproteobacteria bacterium TMED54]|tara:strand:+ start:660 stop:1499 length:840 start_codon:yes stop_codon:yes gene_type:complete
MFNFKFYSPHLLLIFLPSALFASEPKPWQMDLQPPSGIIAETATDLHNFLLIVITLISLFVLGLLIYVCWRYRENSNKIASKTSHNTLIEILWTVIPVLILVVIAIPSFKLLYLQEADKEYDMVVKVTGAQWYWNYEYPDEKINFDSYMIEEDKITKTQKRLLDVDNPLIVPEGIKIKFLITGNDVMHSFFIPSLAVQVYSIAGRVNEVWTEIPNGPKTYYGQCNQICGVNHAYMPIVLKSVSKEDYKKWLKEAKTKFASANNNLKIVMNNEKKFKEIN